LFGVCDDVRPDHSFDRSAIFHLASACDDYLRRVMAELRKLDYVLPMPCSSQNFIDLAKQEMPEKLVLCATGAQLSLVRHKAELPRGA
jgi:hypothetical protein